MNKVTNSRSIEGVVIRAEDGEGLALAHNDFLDDREEVARDGADWIVPDQARMVVAGRVEISH
jgi:hypothetical protein